MELPRLSPPAEGPREPVEANAGAAVPAPGAPAAEARSIGAESRGAGEAASTSNVGQAVRDEIAGSALGGGRVDLRDVPQATTAKRIDSMLALIKSNAVLAGGRLSRAEVNEQLLQLAANGYSEAAQKQLTEQLGKQLRIGPGQRVGADDAVDLAWVAKKLRESVPDRQVKLAKLTTFFHDQGFRLRWFDKAPPSDASYQLDRDAFREALKRAEQNGKPLDRRGALRLLAHLQNVRDPADFEWAQWQIERRVRHGKLSFSDASVTSALKELFSERNERPINTREIAVTAYFLRKAIEADDGSAASRAKVIAYGEAIERCIARANSDGDPDAIFFAQRVLNRELAKAERKGLDVGYLRTRFGSLIAPCLEGRVDRYTLTRSVDRMVREGSISCELGYMLRTAVVTSNTTQELSSTLRSVSFQAHMILAQAMREAWEELMETFRRNASDDLLDSNGRVIETAFQRYMKRLQRELDKKIGELRPLREREQRMRAQVSGSRQAVRSAIAGEHDPSRKASLVAKDSALASAEAGIKKTPDPHNA